MNKKDISGKKFGKLTAIKFSHINNDNHYWIFKCRCGNNKAILRSHVTSGKTKSCGCFKIESPSNLKHGMCETKIYKSYTAMVRRCSDKKVKNYAGRGIKCEWKSFKEFLNDMYKPYLLHVKKHGEKNTTIDRVNNDGNYSKENCRWANQKIQQGNRRNNIFITYKGQTHTFLEWSIKLKINLGTLYNRYYKKWPVEKMFAENWVKSS